MYIAVGNNPNSRAVNVVLYNTSASDMYTAGRIAIELKDTLGNTYLPIGTSSYIYILGSVITSGSSLTTTVSYASSYMLPSATISEYRISVTNLSTGSIDVKAQFVDESHRLVFMSREDILNA